MTKVLVVDDSLSVRKVVERALAGRQIDVGCAASSSRWMACSGPSSRTARVSWSRRRETRAWTPTWRPRSAPASPSRPTASAASWVVARSRASSSSTRRAWSCSTAWRPPGSSPWASASRTCSARSATMRGGRCPSWRGRCDVGRYRLSRLMRWLHALGVAVAYVVVTGVLFWLDLGDGGVAPAWTNVRVPFFYAVLSLLFLRRASLARRLSWVGGACLTHVTLGLTAAAAFATLADLATLPAAACAL